MELTLNSSYTGDQGIRVTSLEPLRVLNKFAWLTAACNLNLPNVTQRSKHLKPNVKFPANNVGDLC